MSDGLFVASTGAVARERQLEVLSSNLANASTDGFQADRTSFSTVLAAVRAGPSGPDKAYTATNGTETSHVQGALRSTGRDLDVALRDDAFFALQPAGGKGEVYTRLGHFDVNKQGMLVSADGMLVLGQDGKPIGGLDATARIEADGTVSAGGAAKGKLRTVHFDDPKVLEKQGALHYGAPASVKPLAVAPDLATASIETSNVNPIAAVTELVRVQRSFDSSIRAIDAYREMDRQLQSNVAGR